MKTRYDKLSDAEKLLVDEILKDEKNIKRLYRIGCYVEDFNECAKMFCKEHNINVNTFRCLMEEIKPLLKERQVQRLESAKESRLVFKKYSNYGKIITAIVNEKNKKVQKKLLLKHRDVFSKCCNKYAEETGKYKEIKELVIFYRTVLEEEQLEKTSSRDYITINSLRKSVIDLKDKFEQNNCYLDMNLKIVNGRIDYITKKTDEYNQELNEYRELVKNIIDYIKNLILTECSENYEQFNARHYYSITNIEPMSLFAKESKDENNLLVQRIIKRAHLLRSTYDIRPKIISNTFFVNNNSYTYQGVTLEKEELLEIFNTIPDEVPKTEFIFYEYCKDYIIRKKENNKVYKKEQIVEKECQ